MEKPEVLRRLADPVWIRSILEALSLTFGHNVHFSGVFHGIVWLIIVVVTMVVVEELVVRLYRRLA